MKINIGSTLLSMSGSRHRAEWVAYPGADAFEGDEPREWRLSWLPDRLVTRNEAISGLMLAGGLEEAESTRERLAPALGSWARELGLSFGEAAEFVAAAPGLDPAGLDRADREVEGTAVGPVGESAMVPAREPDADEVAE
ncbi:hypothetical protein LWF15_13895 [Kineosporia rhizophila]|uniref:hypothetical protein n=1 Tax=Kineosporia rhizophila TaxID=84633 RepID=UPI001E37859C|nr:hypothetical protein [Kineosporia rhizophila]MCE0536600.1 hypothetical protein [Kineosporia rhizophila]